MKSVKRKGYLGFLVVEKRNHLAVHGIFTCKELAENHIEKTIPEYVKKGFFMDKTLTANDFEVIYK